MAKELVTEELWSKIEPLLPADPPHPKGGRPRVSNRVALRGILFVLKSGIPWEMLPQEMGCGSGMTCWRRLTGANSHDVTQLIPLVDSIPPVKGKVGHPKSKPEIVQADCGYDSQPHRVQLIAKNIQPVVAKRGEPHGSGLGKTQWFVERTISWLHQFRRLRIRFEKLSEIHEAFPKIGCCLICQNFISRFC